MMRRVIALIVSLSLLFPHATFVTADDEESPVGFDRDNALLEEVETRHGELEEVFRVYLKFHLAEVGKRLFTMKKLKGSEENPTYTPSSHLFSAYPKPRASHTWTEGDCFICEYPELEPYIGKSVNDYRLLKEGYQQARGHYEQLLQGEFEKSGDCTSCHSSATKIVTQYPKRDILRGLDLWLYGDGLPTGHLHRPTESRQSIFSRYLERKRKDLEQKKKDLAERSKKSFEAKVEASFAELQLSEEPRLTDSDLVALYGETLQEQQGVLQQIPLLVDVEKWDTAPGELRERVKLQLHSYWIDAAKFVLLHFLAPGHVRNSAANLLRQSSKKGAKDLALLIDTGVMHMDESMPGAEDLQKLVEAFSLKISGKLASRLAWFPLVVLDREGALSLSPALLEKLKVIALYASPHRPENLAEALRGAIFENLQQAWLQLEGFRPGSIRELHERLESALPESLKALDREALRENLDRTVGIATFNKLNEGIFEKDADQPLLFDLEVTEAIWGEKVAEKFPEDEERQFRILENKLIRNQESERMTTRINLLGGWSGKEEARKRLLAPALIKMYEVHAQTGEEEAVALKDQLSQLLTRLNDPLPGPKLRDEMMAQFDAMAAHAAKLYPWPDHLKALQEAREGLAELKWFPGLLRRDLQGLISARFREDLMAFLKTRFLEAKEAAVKVWLKREGDAANLLSKKLSDLSAAGGPVDTWVEEILKPLEKRETGEGPLEGLQFLTLNVFDQIHTSSKLGKRVKDYRVRKGDSESSLFLDGGSDAQNVSYPPLFGLLPQRIEDTPENFILAVVASQKKIDEILEESIKKHRFAQNDDEKTRLKYYATTKFFEALQGEKRATAEEALGKKISELNSITEKEIPLEGERGGFRHEVAESGKIYILLSALKKDLFDREDLSDEWRGNPTYKPTPLGRFLLRQDEAAQFAFLALRESKFYNTFPIFAVKLPHPWMRTFSRGELLLNRLDLKDLDSAEHKIAPLIEIMAEMMGPFNESRLSFDHVDRIRSLYAAHVQKRGASAHEGVVSHSSMERHFNTPVDLALLMMIADGKLPTSEGPREISSALRTLDENLSLHPFLEWREFGEAVDPSEWSRWKNPRSFEESPYDFKILQILDPQKNSNETPFDFKILSLGHFNAKAFLKFLLENGIITLSPQFDEEVRYWEARVPFYLSEEIWNKKIVPIVEFAKEASAKYRQKLDVELTAIDPSRLLTEAIFFPNEGRALVSWTAPSHEGLLGFDVYRRDPNEKNSSFFQLNKALILAEMREEGDFAHYYWIDKGSVRGASEYRIATVDTTGRRTLTDSIILSEASPEEELSQYREAIEEVNEWGRQESAPRLEEDAGNQIEKWERKKELQQWGAALSQSREALVETFDRETEQHYKRIAPKKFGDLCLEAFAEFQKSAPRDFLPGLRYSSPMTEIRILQEEGSPSSYEEFCGEREFAEFQKGPIAEWVRASMKDYLIKLLLHTALEEQRHNIKVSLNTIANINSDQMVRDVKKQSTFLFRTSAIVNQMGAAWKVWTQEGEGGAGSVAQLSGNELKEFEAIFDLSSQVDETQRWLLSLALQKNFLEEFFASDANQFLHSWWFIGALIGTSILAAIWCPALIPLIKLANAAWITSFLGEPIYHVYQEFFSEDAKTEAEQKKLVQTLHATRPIVLGEESIVMIEPSDLFAGEEIDQQKEASLTNLGFSFGFLLAFPYLLRFAFAVVKVPIRASLWAYNRGKIHWQLLSIQRAARRLGFDPGRGESLFPSPEAIEEKLFQRLQEEALTRHIEPPHRSAKELRSMKMSDLKKEILSTFGSEEGAGIWESYLLLHRQEPILNIIHVERIYTALERFGIDWRRRWVDPIEFYRSVHQQLEEKLGRGLGRLERAIGDLEERWLNRGAAEESEAITTREAESLCQEIQGETFSALEEAYGIEGAKGYKEAFASVTRWKDYLRVTLFLERPIQFASALGYERRGAFPNSAEELSKAFDRSREKLLKQKESGELTPAQYEDKIAGLGQAKQAFSELLSATPQQLENLVRQFEMGTKYRLEARGEAQLVLVEDFLVHRGENVAFRHNYISENPFVKWLDALFGKKIALRPQPSSQKSLPLKE